ACRGFGAEAASAASNGKTAHSATTSGSENSPRAGDSVQRRRAPPQTGRPLTPPRRAGARTHRVQGIRCRGGERRLKREDRSLRHDERERELTACRGFGAEAASAASNGKTAHSATTSGSENSPRAGDSVQRRRAPPQTGRPLTPPRRAGARSGGGRGIRTPGTLPGTVVFKTTASDSS